MRIPFLSFVEMNKEIKKDILRAFEKFVDSGSYVLGREVREFELEYACYNQCKYCVGVSNGLDALHLALKALKIGKGDEVILPSNTYIATLLAVSYVGACPVLVEPDIHTYNIDPKKIENAISNRTRVIMPVHLYGQSCSMTEIMDLAESKKIFVVEDNAQSHGAKWNGRQTGTWGHINATSFYPGKNLGAFGDSGAVTTNSQELANFVAVLRNYGSHEKYYNDVIGYNMRLDEVQAAMLRIKLKYLDQWTKNRQKIAQLYNELLKGVGDIVLPAVAPEATHSYHLYVIRTEKRNDLHNFLKSKEIGTLIHYPVPPHLQKAYSDLGYKKGDFPIAEKIADTCLSLPLWPGMPIETVEEVVDSIKQFYRC